MTTAGLLFVATHDPIGKCIAEITKQPYSNLGFVCPSIHTGKRQVYWIDPWGILTANVVENSTIEDLMRHPLIAKMTYRRLRDHNIAGLWGLAVASTLNNAKKPSLRESIFYLFGLNIESEKQINSLDALGQVYKKMGWEFPPSNCSTGLNVNYETYSANAQGAIKAISALGKTFLSQQSRFHGLLDVSNYFNAPEDIPLTPPSPSYRELILAQATQNAAPIIREACALVFSEINTNPLFLSVIIAGINENIRAQSEQMQFLLTSLNAYANIGNEIIEKVRAGKDRGKLDCAELEPVYQELKQLNSSLQLFGISTPKL